MPIWVLVLRKTKRKTAPTSSEAADLRAATNKLQSNLLLCNLMSKPARRLKRCFPLFPDKKPAKQLRIR